VFEAAVNDGAEELGAEEEVAEAGGVDGGAAGLLGGGICLLVLLLLLIVKKLLLVGVRLCARAPRQSRHSARSDLVIGVAPAFARAHHCPSFGCSAGAPVCPLGLLPSRKTLLRKVSHFL
jgi:hypothetical protein